MDIQNLFKETIAEAVLSGVNGLDIIACIGNHLIYLNRKIYFQYIINIEIRKVSFFKFISKIRGIVQYKLEIELHDLVIPVHLFFMNMALI